MKYGVACTLLAVVSVGEVVDCGGPIDVLFVQDTTQSFGEFLASVTRQVPEVIDAVVVGHEGSRFGVVEFKDKPYWPFGYHMDNCYNLLTEFTTDPLEIQAGYARLWGSSGADLPESQYHAIINAIYDPRLKWGEVTVEGRTPAKLIILVTDAKPHLHNDYLNYIGWETSERPMPDFLAPYPGRPVNTENMTADCDIYDNPHFDQVKEALQSNDVYLAMFIPPDVDAGVIEAWQWVNRDLLGQDDAFIIYVNMDGSGFMQGVIDAMKTVGVYSCPTTTTAEPTTAVPTTQTPTTTTSTPFDITEIPQGSGIVPTRPNSTSTASPEGSWEVPPACTEECECFKCQKPKSFVRFAEQPTNYKVTAIY